MKKIQQLIKETDFNEIERAFFKEHPLKLHEITNFDQYTIKEMKQHASELFQNFLARVCSIATEPDPTGQYILFATKSLDGDGFHEVTVELVKEQELLENDNVNDVLCYAYNYSEWKYTLGFLVADNKLTQDNMMDVIISFLYEISFFGFSPECTEKAIEELQESIDELNTHSERSHEHYDSMEAFEKVLGLPPQPAKEENPEEAKRDAVVKAMYKYLQYCKFSELERIKESLMEEEYCEGK